MTTAKKKRKKPKRPASRIWSEKELATLADLRSRSNPMEPDRARAVATVASVLVDTAKVEIDYLRLTGNDNSGFIDGAYSPAPDALPAPVGQIAVKKEGTAA